MRGRGDPRDSNPGMDSSSTRGFGGYSSGTEQGRGVRGHWSGRGRYRGTRGGRGAFAVPPGHRGDFGPPPGSFARGRRFRGSGEQVGGRRGSGMPFRGFSSRTRGQDYSAVNKRVYSEVGNGSLVNAQSSSDASMHAHVKMHLQHGFARGCLWCLHRALSPRRVVSGRSLLLHNVR